MSSDHIATLRVVRSRYTDNSPTSNAIDAAIAALEAQQQQAEPVGEVLRIDEGTARVALFNDAVAVGSPLYAAPQQAGVPEGWKEELVTNIKRAAIQGRNVAGTPDTRLASSFVATCDHIENLADQFLGVDLTTAPPPPAGVRPVVDEAMARRLDDYLGGEFDIRIGKQAAHAALTAALARIAPTTGKGGSDDR